MKSMAKGRCSTLIARSLGAVVWLSLSACGAPPEDEARTAGGTEIRLTQQAAVTSEKSYATTDTAGAAAAATSALTTERLVQVSANLPAAGRVDVITFDGLIDRFLQGVASAPGGFNTSLQQAGLGDVVESISRVDGKEVSGLSPDIVLREIYTRAEMHEAGQGERVLAHLYQELASQHPAVADDAEFRGLREIVTNTDPGRLNASAFVFSSAPISNQPLPEAIESSIRALAYVYEQGNSAELIRIGNRAFSRAGFLEVHLAGHSSTKDGMRAAFLAHVPPPRLHEVARQLLKETTRFPALNESPEFLSRVADLDPRLLDFDPTMERVYERISDAEFDLTSRQRQLSEAARIDMPGEIAKRNPDDMRSYARDAGNPQTAQVKNLRQAGAQHYSNYVGSTLEQSSPSLFDFPFSPENRGTPPRGREDTPKPPPPEYRRRVQESNPRPVPRTYRTAIRSARAARGIAVGGELAIDPQFSIHNAAWLANPRDNRFGQFVLEVQRKSDDERFLVRSRTLFADSAMAAVDVLRGGHSGAGRFRDGEILILMSMDPFDVVDPQQTKALEVRAKALEDKVTSASENSSTMAEVFMELMSLQSAATELPRRIVVHPALHGRELAWAAARVDFWFNDLEGLSEEAKTVNGGTPISSELMEIDIGQASTWQFYERSSSVIVRVDENGLGKVGVSQELDSDPLKAASHFEVSMFFFDEGDDGEEGRRLPKLESDLQPLLDWLASNHPDFMRVNDFSEAFSLMRWAQQEGLPLTVIDLVGPPPPIATPDRIVIGEGPKVK